jgi:hypothetical protein
MVMNDYKKAEIAAAKELDDLLEQRTALDKRIARLKQTLLSLHALTDDTFAEEVQAGHVADVIGITDACRNALKVANSPRTAVEIRDWLEDSGYDLSDQANALASIHTVLKRLVLSKEAEPVKRDGKTAYQWCGAKVPKESLPIYITPKERTVRTVRPTTSDDAKTGYKVPPRTLRSGKGSLREQAEEAAKKSEKE